MKLRRGQAKQEISRAQGRQVQGKAHTQPAVKAGSAGKTAGPQCRRTQALWQHQVHALEGGRQCLEEMGAQRSKLHR